MESDSKSPITDQEREQLAEKLDKELDDFIAGLEKRSYTEGWPEDRWQEEMEKHPFFMSKPPNPDEELSPLMEGIQQLKYDTSENSPEELAATYKEEGNFNLKCKKYRLAILSYTEGIKQKCCDDNLNSQLYNNRAAVNYFLKNYRTCLADCQIALKLCPQYEKALVRAAQCCYHLSRYKSCIDYCDQTLAISPSNSVILKLRKDAIIKDKISERDKRKEMILEKKAKMDKEKLLKAIQDRGIRFFGSESGIPSLKQIEPTFPELVQTPVHLKDGRLIWPVIFLYPEYQTSDFIQEFSEDTEFLIQLSEVFKEYPNWDKKQEYTADNINVYFEDIDKQPHMVNTKKTLGQIISDKRYRVDGGTPSFILLPKGSLAEERFLNES